jgi:hypothetical protein
MQCEEAAMLKRATTVISTGLLLVCSGLLYASKSEAAKLELEPCMNGDVSASGTFPTEAAALEFHAAAKQEPCMNAEIPPDGVLARGHGDETAEQIRTAGTE